MPWHEGGEAGTTYSELWNYSQKGNQLHARPVLSQGKNHHNSLEWGEDGLWSWPTYSGKQKISYPRRQITNNLRNNNPNIKNNFHLK